jgi:hypothetical protein
MLLCDLKVSLLGPMQSLPQCLYLFLVKTQLVVCSPKLFLQQPRLLFELICNRCTILQFIELLVHFLIKQLQLLLVLPELLKFTVLWLIFDSVPPADLRNRPPE